MSLNTSQPAASCFIRTPRVREVLADLDTPLSTYLKLADGPYSYLFESVQGGEKWGRYSIIGLPCKRVIKVFDYRIVIEDHGCEVESITVDDPLSWIEDYQAQFDVQVSPELPSFIGGLVGYFGYETIRYIEPSLSGVNKKDALHTPDILLMQSEEVVVFDNLSGKLYIIVLAEPDQEAQADERLAYLEHRLRTAPQQYRPIGTGRSVEESDFVSGFTEDGYKEAVEKAREYINNGDVMQVVLSQRMSIPFKAPPIDLYRSLRSLNPSPYMFYLNLDDFYVVGSSPEILVRSEEGEVTVRPIAGTRRRGRDEEDDRAMERELLEDPKELAEHLMLIDLGRNDVGRIAQIGTVELTDKMVVERYSHVMHIVSNVIGQLKDNASSMDVLRATFPAGTVSGAPKIRAMEIIDELEPVKRGVYAGAVGYLSWSGSMDTAIAIRTAVVKNETLHIQAGAGIVYDSQPKLEWKETMNKGRAVFSAVAMAEAGLDGNHK